MWLLRDVRRLRRVPAAEAALVLRRMRALSSAPEPTRATGTPVPISAGAELTSSGGGDGHATGVALSELGSWPDATVRPPTGPSSGWVPSRPVEPPAPDPDGAPTPSGGLRLRMGRPAAVGLVVVALAGCGMGGASLWRAQPSPAPSTLAPPARLPAASSAVQTPSATSGARAVVHVTGLVRRPGVVTLAPGARVLDAVQAAGGLAHGADPAGVNLARPVVDGEQLVVPRLGAPAAAGASVSAPSGAAGAAPAALLDLNTATLEQLEALPGVGPVVAQRILDWRAQHGRFSSVDELREVAGIGERKFEALAPRVRV